MSKNLNKICLFAGTFIPEGWLECNGKNGTPNVPKLRYTVKGRYQDFTEELTYICRDANFPSEDYDEPFLGQIVMFAGNFIPKSTLACQGQLLNYNSNIALFSLLSTSFGGDGMKNFGIPNIPPIKNDGDGGHPINFAIVVNGVFPRRP